MKLLRFLNFFSRNRGVEYHHRDNRFQHTHHNKHLKMYEVKGIFSNNKNEEKMCPICKNHCDLASSKCKRGEEYAKGK